MTCFCIMFTLESTGFSFYCIWFWGNKMCLFNNWAENISVQTPGLLWLSPNVSLSPRLCTAPSSKIHEKSRSPSSELSHKGSLHCTGPSGLYSTHPVCAVVSIAIWWQIFAQSNEVSLNSSQSSDSVPVSERETQEKFKFAFYSLTFIPK